MVKTFPFLFIPLLLLALLLVGCAPVYCSTPNILSDGECCPDRNKDGQCDVGVVPDAASAFAVEKSSQKPPAPESPVVSLPVKTKDGVLLKINQDDDPFLGNPNAATTLVAFGDYTHKNTQRFHQEVLPQILVTYGDKLKYVFRDYPSLTNPRSQQAAEASECASEQNKFWEYHEKLLDNIYHLTESDLFTYAEQLGLDLTQFEVCLSSHRFADEVLADRKDGDTYVIVNVPTFFVNNEKISGFKTFAAFKPILDAALFDELREERSTIISAESVGKAYMILEDEAALDPTVQVSPYSNTLDFVDASFTASAKDVTKEDSATSQDTAALTVTFTVKKPNQFYEDTYKIILQELLPEGIDHSFFGGVGTNVFVNGNTGIGTRYLPLSTAYLTFWGKSIVYKNEEVLAKDTFTHFLITTAIRDTNKQLLERTNKADIEAYLLLSGKYGGDFITGTDQGFIYLYWDTLNLRQA